MRLWGGRFGQDPDVFMLSFSSSLGYDQRLFRYDIKGSQAHVRMLGKQGVLTHSEVETLVEGLDHVRSKFESGEIPLDPALEDIHTAVETTLRGIVGDLAGKVHTGRSRNDQVALDMHLWCRDAAQELASGLRELQKKLVWQAEEHQGSILPGYTHMQRAQPVLLPHCLLSHFFALERDITRLQAAFESASVSPIGAAALAGSTFPLDPSDTALQLQLSSPYDNSMDAVSDRDFLLEFSFACSTIMVHLSRLAEEILLWTTSEYGYASLPDSLTTGSSIMPQKKNADPAELIRGRVGRVFGDLVSLLTMLKALPTTYCRDLQEDKEPSFHAFDVTSACVHMAKLLVGSLQFKTDRMYKAGSDWPMTVTDLADHLACKGMPFREAHKIAGAFVCYCQDKSLSPAEMTAGDLRSISLALTEDMMSLFDPMTSIGKRDYPMATGPSSVAAQIRKAKEILAKERSV